MIYVSLLEPESSFDGGRLRNKFDRAHSTTAVNSLLRALRAICNILSNDGEDFLADELIVYKQWKARYKVEEQPNGKRERKVKNCFGW